MEATTVDARKEFAYVVRPSYEPPACLSRVAGCAVNLTVGIRPVASHTREASSLKTLGLDSHQGSFRERTLGRTQMECETTGTDRRPGADGEIVEPASPRVDMGQITIRDNQEAGAYELEVDGQTAAGLLYKESGARVTLLATSVFPEFRGNGIGSKLLSEVLTILREEGRTATLGCPFALSYVQAHPEYVDVIDPEFPGNPKAGSHGRMG